MTAAPEFSFVVPVYNEEAVLHELARRLTAVIDGLGGHCEVLLVDDGSRDHSWRILCELHERDARFKPVRLSRNFGHQIAITAGLDLAQGDAVIVMDADLQDPPELVFDLVDRWRDGYDIVYAVRDRRDGDARVKRATARAFYRLLGRLANVEVPRDVGDFRLVDRRAVEAVKSLRENSRYLRGMFAWVGFRQTGVAYDRPARHAGEAKYSYSKLVALAANGVVSFSNVPLRIALSVGLLVSALALLGGVAATIARLATDLIVPGWASIIVVLLFLGGIQLMVLGVMGEYVGRIYEEVRRRPLYIVRDAPGIDAASRVERAFVSPCQSLERAAVASPPDQ